MPPLPGTARPFAGWCVVPDGEIDRVLRRWHPGVHESSAPVVAVAGLPGTGRSTLSTRLGELLPDLRVVDGPDPVATVTVTVFDAAAPLGREELSLLESVAASGTTVVCALTRVDAHWDWPSVLGRDAALLSEHMPAVARHPILPVSAVTGRGLPELRAAVDEALCGADPGHPRRAVLERTRAIVAEAAADLRRDDDTPRLRERRTALIADRDDVRAEGLAALRRLTALARVDLTHQVGDRVRAAATTLRAGLDRSDEDSLREVPQRLRDEVAALTVELDAATSVALTGLGTQVLGETHPVAGPNRPPPAVVDPQPRHRGVEERMVIVVGASAGAGLGRLVMSPMAGSAVFDLIAVPVTLLLGALAAWWLTRMRRVAADRAHLRQWIAEAMAQVRSGLEQRVLTRLVDTEAEIGEAIGRAHRQRVAATEPALADLDRALRENLARTSGRVAAVERDLAVIDRALAEPGDGVVRPSRQ